jgi:hypothetical protein
MGLLDNFLMRMGYNKAAPKSPPGEMLSMAEGYRWEVPSAYEAEKQARLYATLTWISTAIDHSANIAATGLYSVKQVADEPGGGDDTDLPNHDFEKLMRKPNPMQSRGEFLRDAFTMYRVTGNLYLYLNAPAEGVAPLELWIVPTQMMRPLPDGNSYILGYEFTAPGKAPEFVEPWKICHLKTANPNNPFVGLSALQSLAIDAYADLAQQKWNAAFFDKNNAKLPSILAFKAMVGEPEWQKIKAERDREWSGTNRTGVTLLRGVGDSLQLLQATATQEQMEFLESRAFTRGEIYGKLAPGLDSILAINATEANAKIGKAILIEFGVWPVLSQIGEKFSSDILPLYGENLIGAFDDIRPLEVAEEEKFFTINEIRQRRYKAGPLFLDESQAAALAEDMAQEAENNALAVEQLGQARPKPAPFGKADMPPAAKPGKTEKPKGGKQLDPRGLMFVAPIGPQTPLAGDPTAPPPKPPAPPPMQAGGPPGAEKDEPQPDPAAVKAELEAWERLAVKHLATGYDFRPRSLDVFTVGRIKTALKSAQTAAAVKAVFAAERGGDETLRDLTAALREAAAAVKG